MNQHKTDVCDKETPFYKLNNFHMIWYTASVTKNAPLCLIIDCLVISHALNNFYDYEYHYHDLYTVKNEKNFTSRIICFNNIVYC